MTELPSGANRAAALDESGENLAAPTITSDKPTATAISSSSSSAAAAAAAISRQQPPPSGFHTYAGDIEGGLRLRLRFIDNQKRQLRRSDHPNDIGRHRLHRCRDDDDDDVECPIERSGSDAVHSSERTNNGDSTTSFILTFNETHRRNKSASRWVLKKEKAPKAKLRRPADSESRNLSGSFRLKAMSSDDLDWKTSWSRLLANNCLGAERGIGPGGRGSSDRATAAPAHRLMKSERAYNWKDSTTGMTSDSANNATEMNYDKHYDYNDDDDDDCSHNLFDSDMRPAEQRRQQQQHLFEPKLARKLRSAESLLLLAGLLLPSENGAANKLAPIGRLKGAREEENREEERDNLFKSVTATKDHEMIGAGESMMMMMKMNEEDDPRDNRSASCCWRLGGRDCGKKIAGREQATVQLHSDWYLSEWLLNDGSIMDNCRRLPGWIWATNGLGASWRRPARSNGPTAGATNEDDKGNEDSEEADELVRALSEVGSTAAAAAATATATAAAVAPDKTAPLEPRNWRQLQQPTSTLGTDASSLPAPAKGRAAGLQRPTLARRQIQSDASAGACHRPSVELIYVVMEKHNSERAERFSPRGGHFGSRPNRGRRASTAAAAAAAGCVIEVGARDSTEAAAASTIVGAAPAALTTAATSYEETSPISDSGSRDDSKVRPDCTGSEGGRAFDTAAAAAAAANSRPERNNDAVGSGNTAGAGLSSQAMSLSSSSPSSSKPREQLQQEESKEGADSTMLDEQPQANRDDDDDYYWLDDDEEDGEMRSGFDVGRRRRQQQPGLEAHAQTEAFGNDDGNCTVLAVIVIDKLNRFIQLKPDLNELILIDDPQQQHSNRKQQANKSGSWRNKQAAGFNGSTTRDSLVSHAVAARRSRASHSGGACWLYKLEPLPSGGLAGGERVELAQQQLELVRGSLLGSVPAPAGSLAAKSCGSGGFLSPICGSVFVELRLNLEFGRHFAKDCPNLYVKYRVVLQNSAASNWRLGRKFTGSQLSGPSLSAGSSKGAEKNVAAININELTAMVVSQQRLADLDQIKPWHSEKPDDAVKERPVEYDDGGGAAARPNWANNRLDGGHFKCAPTTAASTRTGGFGRAHDERQNTCRSLLAEGSTITCRPNACGLFNFASTEEILFELVPKPKQASASAGADEEQLDRELNSNRCEGTKAANSLPPMQTDRREPDNGGSESQPLGPTESSNSDNRGESAPTAGESRSNPLIGDENQQLAPGKADHHAPDPTVSAHDRQIEVRNGEPLQPPLSSSSEKNASADEIKILILLEFYSSDFYHDKPQGWSHLCIPLDELTEPSSSSSSPAAKGFAPSQPIQDDSSLDNDSNSGGIGCLTSGCRSTEKSTRQRRRRRQQQQQQQYVLQVVRPRLFTLIDRLRYYLIGQLPDAMPSIDEFVESNNRYMLQTTQTGQLVASCAITRQHSDPQFDSALMDLIGAGTGTKSRHTHLSSSFSSSYLSEDVRLYASGHHRRQQQQQRLKPTGNLGRPIIDSGELDLDDVVSAFQRAKDRIGRLNVSFQ